MRTRLRVLSVTVAALAWVGLLPTIAAAQAARAGAVAGVVRDMTGAVLPGVTVEAASPALIEKVRSGVTNELGQFQIINLSPGTYTVTFTLSGFRVLRREGIELTAGFTATVNADLSVGGVEETVTVSGQSPLVDIHSTKEQTTFTRDKIDAVPVTKMFMTMGVLIPGVTVGSANTQGSANQDVGGTMGEKNMTLSYHGSAASDMPQNLDGMQPGRGTGQGNLWLANTGMVEETVFDTSGFTAETATSGFRINFITKAGGNSFSGTFFGTYTNDKLEAVNLDAAQQARGVTQYGINKIWDVNPAVGGPIKKDKLWFYYSFRNWGTDDHQSGAFYQKNATSFLYQPDLTTPAVSTSRTHANNLRLTYQASEKSKIGVYADTIYRCVCNREVGVTLAPEAAENTLTPNNLYIQGTWNWTITNRLLLEVGLSYRHETFTYIPYAYFTSEYPNNTGALDGIMVNDTGLGVQYRGLVTLNHNNDSQHAPGKASLSYVTGSHNLKIGAQWAPRNRFSVNNNDVISNIGATYSYNFVNQVPMSVTYYEPALAHDNVALSLGIYAQDQWTFHHLTVNPGLRFDAYHEYLPAQHLVATSLLPARDYPELDNIPNWKDISPRLGVSYDVFGTGKTAVKFSVGRFIEDLSLSGALASSVDPARSTAVNQTTRVWTIPNYVVGDPIPLVPPESQLGPSSNANFGTGNIPIHYDPALISGWGKRAVNWEWSTGVQHELVPGLSVNAGYYHRTRGNFRLTANQFPDLTAASYDPFCVTAPVDARLPGGGGNSICGFYNVQPTFFGKNTNVITSANNFGTVTEKYDGVDITASARLPGGVMFQGGTNTGRIQDNLCDLAGNPTLSALSTNAFAGSTVIPAVAALPVPNNPAGTCDAKIPFLTQVKMLGVYPLPWWGLQTSATFQSLPGPQITASWSAPASAVTGLGRPLSGGARTVTVPVVPPGTLYAPRLNQLDVRLSKVFTTHGRVRIQPQFDLYNVFNQNVSTQVNNTFSPSNTVWQTPVVILGGRLAKFGVDLKF